ncbi:Carboxypeptidase [Balamuthia mandrillaris]
MKLLPSFCLGALLLALAALLASAQQYPVTQLPGYSGPALKMYSGYVTVDVVRNRRLFYWFVESQGNPSTDPLVFWFNGGPGCSSLGGLLSEHGPFTPAADGTLQYAPISWTKIANVVYFEQPAGVGFSYSDFAPDYNTNDDKAAEDSFTFMEEFLMLNPSFIGRDTWLAGESYGGVYIPTTTAKILDHPKSFIRHQLRGLMVGNPVFNCEAEWSPDVQLNLFYWHGLVSYTNFANWTRQGCNKDSSSAACSYIYNQTITQIGVFDQELKGLGLNHKAKAMPLFRHNYLLQRAAKKSKNQPSLDPDDLYQDFCTGNGTLDFAATIPTNCMPIGERVAAYLNRVDVQKAIHAKPTKWTECTDAINYEPSGANMNDIYLRLFNEAPNVSVLVFAGDIDIATVPFATTQACLGEIANKVRPVSAWQPWFVNGATAGYVEVFDKYTFATIKGAGHEAPQYQPITSFAMFSRFLTRQNLTLPEESLSPSSSSLLHQQQF